MLFQSSLKIIRRTNISFSIKQTLKHVHYSIFHLIKERAAISEPRSNLLKKIDKFERVEGIGPTLKDWKSLVLPLNYTRTEVYFIRKLL